MSGENALVTSDQPEGEQAAEPEKTSDTGAEESQEGEQGESGSEGDKAEGEGSDKEADGEGEKDAKPKTPWYERRLRQQSAKIAEMARHQEMQAQLIETLYGQRSADGGEQGEQPPAKPAPVLTEAAIEAKARELVEAQSFNSACNAANDEGVKQYGEAFRQSVQTLQAIGVMDRTFLQAAIDTDKPAAVIHYLGQNPEEMERISGLSPTKMAVALERVASKATAKGAAPVSKVPAPVKPVGGKTVSEGDPNKMSMADWLKWREADLAKKQPKR